MDEFELRDYLHIVWKRKWPLLGVVIACLILGGVMTFVATPVYEADAKLLVGARQITTAELQQGVQVSELSRQLLETYAEVIRTTPIVGRAIRNNDLPTSTRKLSEDLTADPILDTQLLRLSYRHPNPTLAQRTVNAVAEEFVTEIEKIEGTRSEQADEAAINVSIVQPALTPRFPVSPRPLLNMSLALLLGLMLGTASVFLVEYLDTTVKDKDDVEARLGLPVLATVPKIRTRADELYLEGDNHSAFAEMFRKLRTAIQLYGGNQRVKTILITSPQSHEGKTTTALNLAAVYAYAGSRTLLVEADLRRPRLHGTFPATGLEGLTMTLHDNSSPLNGIVQTEIPGLSCLPAGSVADNPVDLLASEAMWNVLMGLETQFDTIIIDAPPILPVADATTIAPRVDGVVLVARMHETRRDRLRESAQVIEKVGGKVLGIVLNAVSMDDSSAYHYRHRSTAQS